MLMSDSQKWLVLVGLALSVWVLTLLAPVITPFLAGFGIAYLGAPLVAYIERYGRTRILAVSLVFTLFLLLFILMSLILLPILERQSIALMTKIPHWLDWLEENLLPMLNTLMGAEEEKSYKLILKDTLLAHWKQAGGVLAALVSYVSSSSIGLMAWLMNLILIPVVAFYLLVDWYKLLDHMHALMPRKYEPMLIKLFRECDEVLSSFLRGQLLVMLALSIVYVVGLWLVGLEFALLIGLLAGLVSFVPYLGFIVGILAAGIAAFMQFHDVLHLVLVLGVFGVGQVLETIWLTPSLVGDKIGLHPVAVMFAVMAGGQLFGFIGVLLALPAAAVLMVLVRHAHSNYLKSNLYRHIDGSPR